jgi:SpoIID/LytB domain protein
LRLRSRLTSLAVAAIGALVAVTGLLPITAVGPAPVRAATPVSVPSTVTFFGRGYGHGVGMSQYGARGRAFAGQTATQILAHYYVGATLGKVDPTTPIRVLVLPDFSASATKPIELYGRGTGWTMTGPTTVFPAGAKITVVPTVKTVDGVTKTTWRVTVTSTDGVVLYAAATTGLRLTPAGPTGRIQVWTRPSTKDEYRGTIRVRLGSVAQVINETTLETYLRGVVPAEMPSTWPTEALKAQAIAARSYAARRLRPGTSYYDVKDDTTSQVYLGFEGERATTDAVISATAGRVLMSGSAIANTLFHSTGGGATEHNENVFVSSTGAKVAGPVSYLRGSSDRRADGTAYDDAAPFATWQMRPYTRSQLSAWLAADARTDVGTLQAWDLSRRGVSGRLISVTLVASGGTRTVSGAVFRSVINAGRPATDPSMRSTLVDTKPIP